MDELAFLMDWDLEAINEVPTTNPYFSHLFSEQDHDELLFGSFPEFSKTTNVLIHEFEELCKPNFYPLSSQTILTSSLATPKEPEQVKEIKAASHQDLQIPAVSKFKKRYKLNTIVIIICILL